MDEAYKELVEELLKKKTLQQEEARELHTQSTIGFFQTYVKPVKKPSIKAPGKKQRDTGRKTIFDYFGS